MKLFGTAFLAVLVVASAGAQTQNVTRKDIWEPNRHIKDQHITLIPWGSGSIAETDETANDGAFSLRISTHNYFQGGILKLGNPVDLSSSYSDNNNLLEFTFRTADQLVINGGGPGMGSMGGPGKLGGPGGPGGFGRGGAQGGPPGGQQGQGDPRLNGNRAGLGSGQPPQGGFGGSGERAGLGRGAGAQGGFGGSGERAGIGGGQGFGGRGPAGEGQQVPAPALDMVRVIIWTSDGKKSEAYLPLPPAVANHPWKQVAIPLEKVNGFANTNKSISAISFSGDATTTYYVGDIQVVNDPTPITGKMNATEALNLALGDTVTFIGTGDGGSSILKYCWSFDNASGSTNPDEIKVDAVGQGVKHKFRKAGTFNVTLMIQDYYGLKKPFVTSVKVTVNP
jgi:hypothetical protein